LLYQDQHTEPKTRVLLEKQFVSISREAMRTMFKFSPRQSPASPLDSDGCLRAAELLWQTPFIDFLDLQHQELAALKDRPAAVVLAAAIPNSALRTKLRPTLSRHWAEGPSVLRTAIAADGLSAEPGFLTVLKSVVHENQTGDSPRLRHVNLNKKPSNPQQTSEERHQSALTEDWNKLTEDLVRNICGCCHKAALDRIADAYREGSSPPTESFPDDTPVKPHPQGKVMAVFRFDWPGKYGPRLPQSAEEAMRVGYVRIEQRAKLDRLPTYYRRQMQPAIEHPTTNCLWLDGLKEMKKEGRLQSVDVLISRPNAKVSLPANEEQELTVEILVVETPHLGK
jgi:hypothetical protein